MSNNRNSPMNEKIKQSLVSVIVPSFNHEKYITQCIESIINQTYKNLELIVIDDGSRDNSRKILENLQLKYNFKLVFQENRGISYTLNRSIKEFSSGEFIAFCASDDYWVLNKLEKQVAFMEKNRFYPMCYGRTYYVNEESNILPKVPVKNTNFRAGCLFEEIFLFKLDLPVNYLFRKSIFDEIGYYDERMSAEDYYMDLKISSKYSIGFVDEYISYYRLNDTTFKNIRFDQISDSHLMTIEHFKEHHKYKEAKRMVYLRKFETFSGITKLKVKAITNLPKALPLFYKKRFIRACIKIILFWK